MKRKLVKVSDHRICKNCKYGSGREYKLGCDYAEVAGKSRIFEDGKMAYDPKYCDKYEEGCKERKEIVI